jgi:hypothetical protein
VKADHVLNLSLLALAAVMILAAFAVYRTPAMAFFLEGFRLCG